MYIYIYIHTGVPGFRMQSTSSSSTASGLYG